jgi:hypothetical protein
VQGGVHGQGQGAAALGAEDDHGAGVADRHAAARAGHDDAAQRLRRAAGHEAQAIGFAGEDRAGLADGPYLDRRGVLGGVKSRRLHDRDGQERGGGGLRGDLNRYLGEGVAVPEQRAGAVSHEGDAVLAQGPGGAQTHGLARDSGAVGPLKAARAEIAPHEGAPVGGQPHREGVVAFGPGVAQGDVAGLGPDDEVDLLRFKLRAHPLVHQEVLVQRQSLLARVQAARLFFPDADVGLDQTDAEGARLGDGDVDLLDAEEAVGERGGDQRGGEGDLELGQPARGR